MRAALIAALMFIAPRARGAQPQPIFDAHAHYSQDAWERAPRGVTGETARQFLIIC